MKFLIAAVLFIISLTSAFGKHVRIVGGENAEIKDFPYVVSFRYVPQNLIFCCGTIISNYHILTAAHCLQYELDNIRSIRIYTGVSGTFNTDGGVYEIYVIFFHDEFTGEKSDAGINRNDMAIVRITGEILFNEFQSPVELSTTDITHSDNGTMLGWGSTTHPIDTFPQQLQKANMQIYTLSNCRLIFPFEIHDDQFCAINQVGIGACLGDSGGPFIIDGKLAGVISINYPCAHGVPDIFARVYTQLSFIRRNLNF